VAVSLVAATPAGDASGSIKDAVLAGSGPSTTVAALSTISHVIDGPVREAASHPGAGVDVQWLITPDGNVLNTTVIHNP